LHRAGACSAGAARWRECREKGPANDDHDEYPARTAMRPVEPGPPKRTVPPDGMHALDGDVHPLALRGAPASRLPPCAAAQNVGPCRGTRDTTRCLDLRGETFLAEPLPRSQKTPPRLPRRDPRAFAWGPPSGGFRNCRPPGGRSPGTTSRAALRFCQSRSPASTSCNHLSLAEPRRPRVRNAEAPGWRAAGGRSPWPTGSISTPLRTASSPWAGRVSGSTRVTSTSRRTRGCHRGGDLDGWLAMPPVRRSRIPE